MIVTGDMDVTQTNVEALRDHHSAMVADWESGAVANVCPMNEMPCLIVRGVTDRPSGPPAEQFERFRANVSLVMDRAWQVFSPAACTTSGTMRRRVQRSGSRRSFNASSWQSLFFANVQPAARDRARAARTASTPAPRRRRRPVAAT